MKLSQRIRQAMLDHAREYPDGDWKAVNNRLGLLWHEAFPILVKNRIDPWYGGNEGSADQLEKLGM